MFKIPTGACLTTGKPAENTTIVLVANDSVNLSNKKEFATKSDKTNIYIDYSKILELPKKQTILIGDKIKLQIDKVDTTDQVLNCTVIRGGEITKVTDAFVPGVKLDLPPIGKEFLDILKFGKENSIDMLFVPIQDPQSFNMIKCHVNSEGSSKSMMVIAKLEGQSAVDNVDKIIEKADGVLIARARLGMNMPPERVIVAQKCIIAKCLKAGIPSIVSSHMLETMRTDAKEATRAEISDIVNATLDGCDCTMLESETLGDNAVECIQKMQDTIMETEQMINYRRWFRDLLTQVSVPSDTATTTAISACTAAMVTNASAIIVLTVSGKTARLVAKYRPECPIVIVTPNASTVRQCLLLRGASPILVKGECF
jgi:pyruvate kinase